MVLIVEGYQKPQEDHFAPEILHIGDFTKRVTFEKAAAVTAEIYA